MNNPLNTTKSKVIAGSAAAIMTIGIVASATAESELKGSVSTDPVTTESPVDMTADEPEAQTELGNIDMPVSTSAAPAPAQPPLPVMLIGDSITDWNEPLVQSTLDNCGTRVLIDALAGRGIVDESYVKPNAVKAASGSVDTETWLFQIGSNELWNGVTEENSAFLIESLLEQTDPSDRVLWVNTYITSPDIDYQTFNETLEKYPRIEIIDWAGAAAPELLQDPVHPTPEGAQVMADLYCAALSEPD